MTDESGRKIEIQNVRELHIHVEEGAQANFASDNAYIDARQNNNLITDVTEEAQKRTEGAGKHSSAVRLNEMLLLRYSAGIDDEIVSDICLNAEGQEKTLLGYEECLDFMKQRNLPCIQICGEGGSGKTCYLIKTAIYAQQNGETAFYVRLNDINEAEAGEKEQFLEHAVQSQIKEGTLEEIFEEENLFLLLDGFNEVKRSDRSILSKQIKRILNKENVRIIISSRRKVEGISDLFGILSFTMEKLQTQQIESYLNNNNIELRKTEKFWGLLSNPMMLTIYAKTNAELRCSKDVDYFRFYVEYETRGELIANYLESLIAKRFMQMTGRADMERELVILLYIMHFILPYVAYGLEKGGQFSVETDELHRYIAEELKRYGENHEFIRVWYEKREISDISCLESLDTVHVMEYLKDFSTVFYKENVWRYAHHLFRDQLAASYMVSECERGIWMQEIPKVICRNVSEEVLGFTGELLGTYKKRRQEKKKDVLHSLLDLLRGKDAGEIHMALYHVLQIWIRSGCNLAGEDFSGLDLKGQILSPYIQSDGGIMKTDFSEAVIYPENLLPVGHASRVTHVCYSPDSTILATASDDGFVCLWDAYTGVLLQKLCLDSYSFISGLEFSEDGELIACANFEYTCVWEVSSGKRRFCLGGHNGEIISDIAFHPSGLELATGGHDGNICIWDMQTGNLLFHLEAGKRRGYYEERVALKYSSDGKYLAAGYENGEIRVWNGANGSVVHILQGHKKEIRDINFSSDGKVLATADWDGTAILWDVEDGRLLKSLDGHRGGIFEIKFSPDDQIAATASWDKTVRIWNVKTGACLHVLEAHKDAVQRVRFHPYKEYLAASGCDGLVTIWNTDNGELIHKLAIHNDIVGAIEFSPNGNLLATASLDENVCVWSTQSWNMLHFLKNNGRRVSELWIRDDKKIFTRDYPEETVRLWDLNAHKCIWKKENVSYGFIVHPKGNTYIEQPSANSIQMCDIGKNTVVWQKVFETGIRTFSYNSVKDEIVVLLKCRRIIILDFKTGKQKAALAEEADSIVLSSDGERLAGSTPHDLFVWDCQSWDIAVTYRKESEGYMNLNFAEDSRYLAVNQYGAGYCFINLEKESDSIVKMKNWKQGGEKRREANLCTEKPFYITVSDNNEVRTWDYNTGTEKNKMQLPPGRIRETTYHLASGIAAALYDTGRIIVWDVQKEEGLSDISGAAEEGWRLRFNENGDRLIFVAGPVVYSIDWMTGQKEILLDQRYEENLRGCRLQNAVFDDSMRQEDIELLKRY